MVQSTRVILYKCRIAQQVDAQLLSWMLPASGVNGCGTTAASFAKRGVKAAVAWIQLLSNRHRRAVSPADLHRKCAQAVGVRTS